MFIGYPGKTLVAVEMPHTAAEARAFARRMNEGARRQRAADDHAHRTRQAEFDEQRRRIEAYGRRGRTRARIDPHAVYAERNRPRPSDEQPMRAPQAARRPGSFGELAARYYGAPSGAELIPAGPRGGQR